MKVLRTPDFEVEGYPWETRYAETSDGLRMAYVDEGTGPVVLLLHGEPSWGYLYRTMVPVLLDAGLRVVVPDLIGFGRSDKPSEVEDYTYARHVEWLRSALFDDRVARINGNLTLVCQDWGGLLGLRLVADDPDRFARVCTANTAQGIPTSLLSRFAVIEIGLPDADHFARIVETLKSDLAEEIGLPDARLLPELDGEKVNFLREIFRQSRDMRLLRRLLRRLIVDGTQGAPEIIH